MASDKKITVQHEFDSFCKTVLRNQARDIYDEMKRRNQRLISLSTLMENDSLVLAVYDEYDTDYFHFDVDGYDVKIENSQLAEAIMNLTKQKQTIVLLHFFLELSDQKIADMMDLTRRNVTYHKLNSLEKIKRYLEDHKTD